MTINTDAQQQQDDAQQQPPDGPANPPAPGAGEPNPPAANDSDDDDDERDEDDAADDASRSGREKRYRLRLRAAERERDEARNLLNATRAAIVDSVVQAAGVDPRLMAAAGHTVDALLGDDGLVDHGKLADAISNTAKEFRVPPRPRPPAPAQQQGQSNGGGAPGKSTWAGALKGE